MTSSRPPTSSIIGRATELRALDEFLDLVATGPALLLLEGDPRRQDRPSGSNVLVPFAS